MLYKTLNEELQSSVILPPSIRFWLQEALVGLPVRVKVDCWGSEEVWTGAQESPQAPVLTVRFQHPGVLKALILSQDPLVLVEAYLQGHLHFNGTTDDAIQLVLQMSGARAGAVLSCKAWLAAARLPSIDIGYRQKSPWKNLKVGTPERDRLAIQHHYDVGNDFYRLWLDSNLLYSCAHFGHPESSLQAAQEEKLDIICRKLSLNPGESFLDIGCGWGALLRWAAKNYGVQAHGITVSQEQFAFNQQKVQEEGLQSCVSVSLLDYRQLPEIPTFDKISSVGMIEHVGIKNYPIYFSRILQTLRPGGLFLNHGIATHRQWNGTSPGERFIHKYIFPDGDLSRLSTVISCAEESGWEIVDVESWRPHYVKTLRSWASNLERIKKQAVQLVGQPKVQLWRLYLLGSALAFENNHMTIFQTLLRRQEDSCWDLPLSRASWLA